MLVTYRVKGLMRKEKKRKIARPLILTNNVYFLTR